MAIGKPEGTVSAVGGGPRGGFPGGGVARGTGRLRGVRQPSVRRTAKGGKKVNDLTGKKKISRGEREDWKMNLRQSNASTPRNKRTSVAKLSTYNEKTGKYAVAVNKNAPRTRAVVTTKNTAGTRKSSSRTRPRPPIVGRKVTATKKVLKKHGVKTIKLGRGNAVADTKKTVNKFTGKSQDTKYARKTLTPELKKFLSENKESIRKSRTTPQKRLQRNSDYWTRQNVPKSIRNNKVKINKYADNVDVRMAKRKLNRIAKKGGF